MSEIKVNKISPRTACGTTTLGDSGDTFTIPAGVTITNNGTANGFGATGAVNWQTTVKTSGFTAVAGEGYFVNTTSGAISVNLPAGTAGAVVGFKDYAGTFSASNKVTLVQNGSDKIGGSTENALLNTEGLAVTLVFIDSTQGWLVTDSGLQSDATQAEYVAATGGTVLTVGDFKTHVFTGPGTFCVSNAGNCQGSQTVDYFVVAGGGGSSNNPDAGAAGAGAGGFRLSNSVGCVPAPTMSPLANPTGLPVTATGYPITVGAGGTNQPPGDPPSDPRNPGNSSIFAGSTTITSAGGGASGRTGVGLTGGSGGGGSQGPTPSSGYAGGAGNTPPVSPPQGNPGGTGFDGLSISNTGGGGGGAGAAGTNAVLSTGGPGGTGSFVADPFFGPTAPSYGTPGPVSSVRYFAGGGGGNTDSGRPVPSYGQGGAGGGGNAIRFPCVPSESNGVVNTGGGSGAGGPSGGGSGIVVIRYKFQN
jgi:hypothetical protein